MTDESNVEFVGNMKPQRLTSFEEDFKNERTQILTDQARFAKYGTNSAKKADLMAGGQVEELARERLPEKD